MRAFQNVARCSDKRPAKQWNGTELLRERDASRQAGDHSRVRISLPRARSRPLDKAFSTRKRTAGPHPPVQLSTKETLYHKIAPFSTPHNTSTCIKINIASKFICFGPCSAYLWDDPADPRTFCSPNLPRPAPATLTRTNQTPRSAARHTPGARSSRPTPTSCTAHTSRPRAHRSVSRRPRLKANDPRVFPERLLDLNSLSQI